MNYLGQYKMQFFYYGHLQCGSNNSTKLNTFEFPFVPGW